MRAIWKYAIPLREMSDDLAFDMPARAEALSFQEQNGEPTLWVMVDPAAPKEVTRFRVVGTGHPFDERAVGRFVGTAQFLGGTLVLHLYEAAYP